jgi:hypothetical protein
MERARTMDDTEIRKIKGTNRVPGAAGPWTALRLRSGQGLGWAFHDAPFLFGQEGLAR